MRTWHAEITLKAAGLTHDQQEAITRTVPGFATVTYDGTTGRATITTPVEAETLQEAAAQAIQAAREAAAQATESPDLVGARITTIEDHEAGVWHTPRLYLVDSTQAARILGVSRQRFNELAENHPDALRPVAELSRGKVYDGAAVQAFKERR